MSTNPIAKKLQMKAGQRAAIFNPPADYLERLDPLPEGVKVVDSPEGQYDFVQVFVKNMEELRQFLATGLSAIKYDGLLWIAYPKGGAKAGTDLNRDILWNAVSQHNLSSVTLVSLDDVWSAMRFRPSERVGQ